MLTDLPTFLSSVLKFKLDKAGFMASLPYLTMAIVLYISGYSSDYLIEKRKVHITSVRKAFCCIGKSLIFLRLILCLFLHTYFTIGLFLQCIFMLMITLTENASFIIFCVTIAVGFGGMPWSAFGCNQLDIGAGVRHSTFAYSHEFYFIIIPVSILIVRKCYYVNFKLFCNHTRYRVPIINWSFNRNKCESIFIIRHFSLKHIYFKIALKTRADWNVVFFISSVIFLFGMLAFAILASGETQEWAIQQSNYNDLSMSQQPTDQAVNHGVDNSDNQKLN
jgi:hypothetical protein